MPLMVGRWRLVRTLIIIAVLACPEWAAAQDKWFAADKAKHFGAGAALAGGGYAVSVPLTKRRGWRVTIGTSVGLAAGAGKEFRDRRRIDARGDQLTDARFQFARHRLRGRARRLRG